MLLALKVNARTVVGVLQHARGKATATPDIAGDLEKTTAVVRYCAALIPFVANPNEILYKAIADSIGSTNSVESHKTGDACTQTVEAVISAVRLLLTEQIQTISNYLAERTKMTAAALRTRQGRNLLLLNEGYTDDAIETIETLPGTLTVLAVRELEQLAKNRTLANNKELRNKLETTWKQTKASGTSFNALLDANGDPELVRCGWSLIGLESLHHIKLVWHQTNKLARNYPDTESSELLTWGWLGLRAALRNYNPNLGFAFSTYACTRIVGAIRDGVRSENPVPKRLNTLSRKASSVEADLIQALGRQPTFNEISEALGIEAKQLTILSRTRTPASIDAIIAGIAHTGNNEPNWLADDITADGTALAGIDAETVRAAVAKLPAEEAEAIRLLIFEDQTPADARQTAGITARQLRQRRDRAFASLRYQLDELRGEY